MNKYNKEDLENLIFTQNLSYEEIGKKFKVSGNAIKKAAKRLGIELPKRRKISNKETFNQNNFKLDLISDKDFILAITNCSSWKEIYTNLGYSVFYSKRLKEKIIQRCKILNVEITFKEKPVSKLLEKSKQELLESRKNYQSYRSAIRKIAKSVYLKENRELKCQVCGYDVYVEIAHIKPVSEFLKDDKIHEINNINNLIALCPNHHWEYDNNKLDIKKYIKK